MSSARSAHKTVTGGGRLPTSKCAVCGDGAVEVLPEFAALPRVTSDCRPFPPGGNIAICETCRAVQKPADDAWHADAAGIYGRYDIFRQAAGGAEQCVFDAASGAAVRRSELVLRRLHAVQPFAPTGKALDVGCGNGPTIRALAAIAPGWRLFGHDLSDAQADVLERIPRFEKLFTGNPADITDRFDLITLSHSLEHLPDPVQGLAALRDKLSVGGRLLVEVPNLRRNVFDLLVADHRSHFDIPALSRTVERAGYAHWAVRDDWAFKELTLLASDQPLGIDASSTRLAELTALNLSERIVWLGATLEAAAEAASSAPTFGLFGTAIAATWLLGPLAQQTEFFVDEDPSRIGQQHEGRPILAPQQVPSGSTVFVPLVSGVAETVARRLRECGVDARVPPPEAFVGV